MGGQNPDRSVSRMYFNCPRLVLPSPLQCLPVVHFLTEFKRPRLTYFLSLLAKGKPPLGDDPLRRVVCFGRPDSTNV